MHLTIKQKSSGIIHSVGDCGYQFCVRRQIYDKKTLSKTDTCHINAQEAPSPQVSGQSAMV